MADGRGRQRVEAEQEAEGNQTSNAVSGACRLLAPQIIRRDRGHEIERTGDDDGNEQVTKKNAAK